MKPFFLLSLLGILLSGTILAQRSKHSRPDRQYQDELSTLSSQLLESVERLRRSFDDGHGETYGYDNQFAPAVSQLKNLIQAINHLLEDAHERKKDSHLLESFPNLYDFFYQADMEIGKLRLTSYQNQDYENLRTAFHKIAARFRNLPVHLDKTYTLADTVGNTIKRNHEANTLYSDYQDFLKSLRHLQEVSDTRWDSPVHLNKDYDEVSLNWNRIQSTLLSQPRSGRHRQGSQSSTNGIVLQLDRYIRDIKIYLTLTYVQEVHVHNCQCGHSEYANSHFANCGHETHVHNCRCGHQEYANSHFANCGHEIHVHNCRCGHQEYANSHYDNCGHETHVHNCRCGHQEYKDAHYGNCGHTVHVHNCRCGHPEYKDQHYGNCGHSGR